MDYDRIKQLATLADLGEKIVANEEFVEIRVGPEGVGGFNLRIKGKTVYSNIPELPAFQFDLPDSLVNKALQFLVLLKTYLNEATVEVAP